jgi:hypothetical protein
MKRPISVGCDVSGDVALSQNLREKPHMTPFTHHPHAFIRPSPEYLQTLPTLRAVTPETDSDSVRRRCRALGCDYQLELKLETNEARFWLITRCVGEPFAGWRVGKVLMESMVGNHDELVPYGSAELKRLQRFDYIAMLRTEIARLLVSPSSMENDNRIREVRAEMCKVIGIVKYNVTQLEDGSLEYEPEHPGGE